MYKKAQKELYGRDVHETEQGFVVYKTFEDSSVYVHLIYVNSNVRDNGVGTDLLDQVVEDTKATVLISYVDLTTLNPELSIKAHLGYGFKIVTASETSISFKKEVTHG